MAVVAKFHVSHVDAYEHNAMVFLHPVYAPPGSDERVTSKEDGSFWDATPSGELKMSVTNAAAAEQFQPGQDYYVTFERASSV